ncbi:MAG: arsenate reductase ArsC [Acidobacteriota bacterium]
MLQPLSQDGRTRQRVLFLCTGNSARSQIGEALLRDLGGDAFDVFSAGSQPRPFVHPLAGEVLRELYGLDLAGHHPKGMDQVPASFDWIISVCDRAADSCPLAPAAGEPMRWSLEDPAEVTGNDEEKKEAFRRTARDLHGRIGAWLRSEAIVLKGAASPEHAP